MCISLKKIYTVLITLIGYSVVAIVGLICFPPCFFVACLPEKWRRDNRFYFFFAMLFYKAVCRATLLPVTWIGLDAMPKQQSLIIANHLSALDIPFVGTLLGTHPHVWLFLIKYAHIIGFGFIARRMNVAIDLSSPQLLMSALKKTVDIAKKTNSHIILFPEGGRARNGKVNDFFAGFASIAQSSKLPVVPIRLTNLDKIYPPGSFLVHRYPITVEVGPTFVMQSSEDRDIFVSRVRAWFDK